MELEKTKIKLSELEKFLEEERVIFASSSYEKKKLTCSFTGYFNVIVGNEIIFRSNNHVDALDKYNSIKN